ncbi:MAG: AAA family ATPase [Zetaproteobacteria bacterium]|nr:AAA family ATPase [Zetaproteobacteria bacterium]
MSIQHLELKHFGVFEHASIDFQPGFSAITGESGSGKSTLVAAFESLLSPRTEKKWIRAGHTWAEVCAIFEPCMPLNSPTRTSKQELHSTRVHIRKRIHRLRASQVWLNGASVTQKEGAAFCQILLQICAQQSGQTLRSLSAQTSWVIASSNTLSNHKAQLERQQRHCTQLLQAWNQDCQQFNHYEQELEYLQNVVTELSEFKPDVTEYESLEASISATEESMKFYHQLQSVIAPSEHPSRNSFWDLDRAFEPLRPALQQSEAFQHLYQQYQDASFALGELYESLTAACTKQQLQQESLHELLARQKAYQQVFKKFRVHSAEQLLDILHKNQNKLEQHQQFLSGSAQQWQQLHETCQAYFQASQHYHLTLQQHTPAFAEQMSLLLGQFGFKQVLLQVKLTPPPHKHLSIDLPVGAQNFLPRCAAEVEDLREQLSTAHKYSHTHTQWQWQNGTPDFRPIHKTCSGGELNRIHLAAHFVATQGRHNYTLLCDEAESGLSGDAALQLGKYVQSLPLSMQVIMITHLPQTAAHARAHGRVIKRSSSTLANPESSFAWLHRQARSEEMARLVSGTETSKEALAYGEALIRKAAYPTQTSTPPKHLPG